MKGPLDRERKNEARREANKIHLRVVVAKMQKGEQLHPEDEVFALSQLSLIFKFRAPELKVTDAAVKATFNVLRERKMDMRYITAAHYDALQSVAESRYLLTIIGKKFAVHVLSDGTSISREIGGTVIDAPEE